MVRTARPHGGGVRARVGVGTSAGSVDGVSMSAIGEKGGLPSSDATTTESESESESPFVFMPEQRLSFGAALAVYTLGGAYACLRDQGLGRLGSLQIGAAADLVVLVRAYVRACVCMHMCSGTCVRVMYL